MSDEQLNLLAKVENTISRQSSLIRWLLGAIGAMVAGGFTVGGWVGIVQIKTYENEAQIEKARMRIEVNTANIAEHEAKLRVLNFRSGQVKPPNE